jgi:hypothetical protein
MIEASADREELGRLSHDFRDRASRLLRSTHEDVDRNILRLLKFIDASPFLAAAVAPSDFQFPSDEALIRATEDVNLSPPIDEQEELAFVYHLLRVLTKEPRSDLWQIVYRYSGTPRPSDAVRVFLQQIVEPPLAYLSGLIAKRYQELGGHASSPSHFTFHAATGAVLQANVAQHGGKISARQHVEGHIAEVRHAANALIELVNSADDRDMPGETREELRDLGERAIEEIEKPAPNPSRLAMIGKRLMRIVETVNASQSVVDCILALGRLLAAGTNVSTSS